VAAIGFELAKKINRDVYIFLMYITEKKRG
jgi:hypothetical protein